MAFGAAVMGVGEHGGHGEHGEHGALCWEKTGPAASDPRRDVRRR